MRKTLFTYWKKALVLNATALLFLAAWHGAVIIRMNRLDPLADRLAALVYLLLLFLPLVAPALLLSSLLCLFLSLFPKTRGKAVPLGVFSNVFLIVFTLFISRTALVMTYFYDLPGGGSLSWARAAFAGKVGLFAAAAALAGWFIFKACLRVPRWLAVCSVAALAVALVLPLFSVEPALSSQTWKLEAPGLPSGGRVYLIGLDGIDWRLADRFMARGKMPALQEIVRKGTRGTLRSLVPSLSPLVWTSIATGMKPSAHGIFNHFGNKLPWRDTLIQLPPGVGLNRLASVVERCFGLGAMRPIEWSRWNRRPFWEVCNAAGLRTGIVNWYGTYPVSKVDGFMVSELYWYQVKKDPRRAALIPTESYVYPEEPLPEEVLLSFRDTPPVAASLHPRDDFAFSLASYLDEKHDPDLLAVYMNGTDGIPHTNFHWHEPGLFNIPAEEAEAHGDPVEQEYRNADILLGKLLEKKTERDMVIVVSDHGHEPVYIPSFLNGDSLTGAHLRWLSPVDGVFAAAGPGVRRGAIVEGASVLDVAPTLLYALGIPLSEELHGKPLLDIFDPEYLAARTLRTIPSYEWISSGERKGTGGGERALEEKMRELRSLGYVN